METLNEIIDKGEIGQFTVDPTMDERYGEKPLFQHKIDRLYELLKGTAFDPAVKNREVKQESAST